MPHHAALIVGAFAERIKFSAVVLFVILWVTFVYFPIAHMVWFWGGPSFASDPTGLVYGIGAIDFAGGTVVHINAGIAGLVGAIMIGKRVGYKKDVMAPHSMTLTMVGASLLWVGWFGFNAGSNLEANTYASLAMINTFVATAAAAVAWIVLESLLAESRRCSVPSRVRSTGLVAVTPAAGFAGPMGAIVLGIVATVICYFFVSVVKNRFDYDDSLDVFGIHCVGGIVGALATGILVNPALGGAGIVDYLDARFPAIYTVPRRRCGAAPGRRHHVAVVRHRRRHPLQDRRPGDRLALRPRSRARRPRSHLAWRSRLPLVVLRPAVRRRPIQSGSTASLPKTKPGPGRVFFGCPRETQAARSRGRGWRAGDQAGGMNGCEIA